MFYVKEQIGDTTITTDIHDENVFTLCHKCGKEIQVDLNDYFGDENFDLSCGLYCDECAKKYVKELHATSQQHEE